MRCQLGVPAGIASFFKTHAEDIFMKKRNLDEACSGYLFLLPSLIVFFSLIIFPVLFSAFLSFTSWNFTSGLSGIQFIGIENFKELLSDKLFKYGFRNTFVYALTVVPVSLVIAVVLAYCLNDKVFCKRGLRTVFFIPYISNAVAMATLFKFMFRNDGPINMFLTSVCGMEKGLRWLSSNDLNRIPIIVLMIWQAIGYEMIVYMAAMQDVSADLYEASSIDGAGKVRQFFSITLPLISPTTFFLLIIEMIGTFKVFTAVHIISGNARGNTSIIAKIYVDAFSNYKFGYASAEAWVLFAIIMLFTAVQFWGERKWVHKG